MDQFTPQSIRDYLANTGEPSIGNPDSVRARQMLGYLTSWNIQTALNSIDSNQQHDWGSDAFLPLLLDLKAAREIVAKATGNQLERVTPAFMLDFCYQLAHSIWQGFSDKPAYPDTLPDTLSRQAFRSAFVQASKKNNGIAPALQPNEFALIARIIDTWHLQNFQRTQLNTLLTQGTEWPSLFDAQPSLSSVLIKSITDLIPASLKIPDLSKVYGLLIHASVEDEDNPDENEFGHPTTPLAYNKYIAALIQDYLLTGVPPHTAEDFPWKAIRISLYEDLHSLEIDRLPSKVSPADLLKGEPVNYSFFNLRPFRPLSSSAFEHFIQQLQKLLALYHETLENYWAAPAPNMTRKRLWADQDKARLKAEALLRVADGTLDLASHELIRQVLSYPVAQPANDQSPASTAQTFALHLTDKATFKQFKLNQGFIITQATETAATLEQYAGRIIYYTPDKGVETFEGWKALAEKIGERLDIPDESTSLIACLTAPDAIQVTEALMESAAGVSLGATIIESELFMERVESRLHQQKLDLQFAYETGKQWALGQGLNHFAIHVDEAADIRHRKDSSRLVAERNKRLIDSIPDELLFNAWTFYQNALPRDAETAPLSRTFFDLPPLKTGALNDAERRKLMLDELASEKTRLLVSEVLARTPYYFPEGFVTSPIAFIVIEKIYRHRLKLMNIQWVVPDSRQYKCFTLEQQLASQLGREDAKKAADLISIGLLGMNAHESESVDVEYSSRQLDTAQATARAMAMDIHTLIGATGTGPDINALCRYLGTALVYPGEAEPSNNDPYLLTYALFLQLLCDLPGFHRLERAILDKLGHPSRTPDAGVLRALALSTIADYLYPPNTYQPGYICGLNLATVALGECPLSQVRKKLQHHLKTTFGNPSARGSGALVFGVLAARYAPELVIDGVPAELDYGQTLNAIHFRHAVALAENVWPTSSLTRRYPELMDFYTENLSENLPDAAKVAISVVGQWPVLHFAMCRGIIPETAIADVSHEHTITALSYIQEQRDLEARTFTQLAQLPPVRRAMAIEQLKPHTGLDLHRRTSFTEAEVQKYFVKGYLEVGRRMKMSPLERYMTCGTGRSFDAKELGFDPEIPGGCTLQNRFDTQYQSFKKDYLQGLVSRMALALHGLPALDRDRILNAYKYIKLSFKNANGEEHPACFGMIALYKKSDREPEYAYELFCPSGTVRLLRQTGHKNIRINFNFSAPSEDDIHHESPYLKKVPDLDQGAYLTGISNQIYGEPRLDLSFYTIARQTSELNRQEKIQYLCQKMVDEVFGKAVELAYDTLRQPTPYELYREGVAAKTEQLATIMVPGYSIYLDISRGKVTVGTFLFGALEVMSFLVPFGSAAVHAMKAYVQLGKLVFRSTSFGVSQLALKSAQTAYAVKHFGVELGKGLAQAANPLGAAVFLFQGGIKGVAFLRASSRFARHQLGAVSALSTGLKIQPLTQYSRGLLRTQNITKLTDSTRANPLAVFKADFSTGRNVLTIPQQQRLFAYGTDLSDLTPVMNIYSKNNKTFIKMQGNPYEVRKKPGDNRWHLYNNDLEGPPVTFNRVNQVWEVAC
jgi:hypothetical protein